jgi:large subunit ribosomal protein L34e
MPRPSRRSRTLRRVFVRTPGSNTVLSYRKRKPSKQVCANCGKVLPGIPHERPHVMRNLPKTKKRPERPMGGVLCSACTRRMIITKARAN